MGLANRADKGIYPGYDVAYVEGAATSESAAILGVWSACEVFFPLNSPTVAYGSKLSYFNMTYIFIPVFFDGCQIRPPYRGIDQDHLTESTIQQTAPYSSLWSSKSASSGTGCTRTAGKAHQEHSFRRQALREYFVRSTWRSVLPTDLCPQHTRYIRVETRP